MSSTIPQHVHIQEVGPRDGLQNEPVFVPTEEKIALINELSRTGVAKIEVTSFTSPKAIPNLRDAETVMQSIDRVPGMLYTVLVPNMKGCERALACDVDEINLFMSASESHNLANLRMPRSRSLAQFAEIISLARQTEVAINVSLSTAFGCPFEGFIDDAVVADLVARYVDLGVDGVTLCDTTGMANPWQVKRLMTSLMARWPTMTFTLHFHDTRNMGLANALAGLECGIDRFDASLGGLGGCPFAPGASGNVCSEDLAHMFMQMGLSTGIDLDRLLEASRTLPSLLGHETSGLVAKAGAATRRYPLPEFVANYLREHTPTLSP